MKYPVTAQRLRQILTEKGLSQQDLANASDVNKSSVSQYLNGTHAPSNISAGKMAAVLGVNPVWLMGFDAPMHDQKARRAASSDLNAEEQRLLKLYRYINDDAKERIFAALETEYEQERKRDGEASA